MPATTATTAPTARELGIKHDGVFVVAVVHPVVPGWMPTAGKAESTFDAAEAKALQSLAAGYVQAWVVSLAGTIEVKA